MFSFLENCLKMGMIRSDRKSLTNAKRYNTYLGCKFTGESKIPETSFRKEHQSPLDST